ncbi:MAG TPA: BrnT family toxin [Trinickia sp.]|nr:BrnT family toxin [Trinickia sp.]
MRTFFFGDTINQMRITFDRAKRDTTCDARGLAFEDDEAVFQGCTLDMVHDRFDYGEERMISVGRLAGRMVIVVWTQRGDARHVISMRKANEREERRFAQRLEQS